MPPHASATAARFDQETKRVSCTEGTRMEILDSIYHWFKGKHLETDDVLPIEGNANGRIFWLDAGTGKTDYRSSGREPL